MAWAARREAARPRERVRVRAKKETRILMQWEEKLFWISRGFRVVLYNIEIVCLEHGLLSKAGSGSWGSERWENDIRNHRKR